MLQSSQVVLWVGNLESEFILSSFVTVIDSVILKVLCLLSYFLIGGLLLSLVLHCEMRKVLKNNFFDHALIEFLFNYTFALGTK